MTRSALVACDLGVTCGVGHLMRCLALAEELLARGWAVVVAADVESVPWVAQALARRGIAHRPAVDGPDQHVAAARDVAADLVVLDSYVQPLETYAALRRQAPLVAVVDGDPGGREADLYLDQNIGAEDDVWPLPEGSHRVAGLRFALMRDEIRAVRAAREGRPTAVSEPSAAPRVLCVFGGTDAYAAGPVVAGLLAETRAAYAATVVCPTPDRAAEVEAVPTGPGQSVRAVGVLDDLPAAVAAADLVVSAAGTSSWELLCLGAATALVAVADNQHESFARIAGTGAAETLGLLERLRDGGAERAAATASLSRLLGDPAARDALARTGRGLVDGRGRERVVDAVEALVAARA